MVIENALVYINKKRTFERCDIRVIDGVIDFVGRYNGEDGDRVDASDYVLLPGLVDVHTHGRIGIDLPREGLEAHGERTHETVVAVEQGFEDRAVAVVVVGR